VSQRVCGHFKTTKLPIKKEKKDKEWVPGMVANTCNPRTWEAEAGRSGVLGQSELHSETSPQGKRNRKREEEKGRKERRQNKNK
jgi:hypothetical protein